ncbi:MAG: peptide-methionine (S)-S-oxide reductase MsrA [Longimicrobiales bacterium]|nr:peptide-methionine (S)-S-oxide reductase MsrA [Longimicrobiales bacterium]
MPTLRPLALVSLIVPVVAASPASAAVPSSPSEAAPPDTAVFAGGCFWCMEPPFDELDGVLSTTSGYAGGHVENPTYEQVTGGGTGHREAVRVVYDPERVNYQQLLETYWTNVDPFDEGGQFCDRGPSYTTAVFAQDDEQARKARASKREISERLTALGHDRSVVTPIVTDADFYPAEEYHQNYYEKHPLQYRFYKWRCGRAQRLEEVWGEAATS